MNSKLKIKIGSIEVEYEGSEDFIKEELSSLLSTVTSLYKEAGVVNQSTVETNSTMPNPQPSPANQTSTNENIGTTNSIAAKLGAKTGTELALAAAARLVIARGLEQFTRKQLLEEMKNATQYYKSSFGSNLSTSLKTLVGDNKFIERAKDTYALKADILQTLESQLV